MLATQTMMQLGIPLTRVLRRLRAVRQQRYTLMGGFFPGVTDQELGDADAPILRTILLGPDAAAVGKALESLDLAGLGVQVTAVRRKGSREVNPGGDTRLAAGDVLVLLGTQGHLAAAEVRLLQG
jgi:CPA2 family monovalent cation:H+ antiporter-2